MQHYSNYLLRFTITCYVHLIIIIYIILKTT